MADFIIKSAAGTGNKTLIQGQDQSGSAYAIQIGDAGATTLTNATITAGTFPAGHVIQVVNNTYTTGSNSSSFGDTIAKVEISSATNYKGTINNVVSGNDVFIMCSFQLRVEGSGVNAGGEVVLTRDTTNLWSGTHYDQYAWGDSSMGFDRITHLNWLDESPATGTNVYYLSGRRYDSNSNMTIKGGGFPFKMILMEIQR